ncbi:MAG: RidA family protein [Rhodobacteraceae bacterium]|nr:RidA family protein [Paracoccaceae bacterium]
MGKIEKRLKDLELVLPRPLQLPPGMKLPFPEVNIRGDRAFISGTGPLNADGSLAGPLGKVGAEVSVEEATHLAHLTGLAMLAGLQRTLGSLERISGWCKVFGMVNSPGSFTQQPAVINGFSHLILDVFGDEIGRHARSAISVASLPMNIAVEIEAEVVFIL